MLVCRCMQVEFNWLRRIPARRFVGAIREPGGSNHEIPLTEFDRLYDTRKQSGPDNDIITAPGGLLKMEIGVMEKIRMWLVLSLGFLFFVLTHVSAKEPEEIWRELGSLSGAERQ